MHGSEQVRILAGPVLSGGARTVTLALQSSGARLVDVVYPARAEFDPHVHDEAWLCLVARGGFEEWSGRAARNTVAAGTVAVYPLGSRHAVRIGAHETRLLHISDPEQEGWTRPVGRIAAGVLWQIGNTLQRVQSGHGDDADLLHLDALVLELRHAQEGGRGAWLETVRAILREQHHRMVSLDELAASVQRHPAHLVRAFRQRWGMTPGEYVRRVRVAAAVRLLRETDAPPSIIALQSGFADQSHMGRWLRRYAGVTPGSLRAPGPRRATGTAP